MTDLIAKVKPRKFGRIYEKLKIFKLLDTYLKMVPLDIRTVQNLDIIIVLLVFFQFALGSFIRFKNNR